MLLTMNQLRNFDAPYMSKMAYMAKMAYMSKMAYMANIGASS